MTTDILNKTIEEVIEQQQVGMDPFVKMEHEQNGQMSPNYKDMNDESMSDIQLTQLFSGPPLKNDDQIRRSTAGEGSSRPMKRNYILHQTFETDEDWRRFYVTEMEHWAKKRVAKQCVEYECRLKRKGCKMALRLINGDGNRPSKALISDGNHDHTKMQPTFSDDVRAIIDRCIEDNYNVKPLMVCEVLKVSRSF